MLNILPQEQKKLLKKEYTFRRIVVWLGLLVVVLVVSLVLLLPSYLISQVKAGEVRTQLEQSKRELDSKLQPSEVTAEVTAAIRHAEDLKPFVAPVSTYALMRIFESKPKSIQISNLAYIHNGVDQPKIMLNGRALDRESLTAFGRALESRPEFGTIDLPVSNFAKEKDIDFTMTITVK